MIAILTFFEFSSAGQPFLSPPITLACFHASGRSNSHLSKFAFPALTASRRLVAPSILAIVEMDI